MATTKATPGMVETTRPLAWMRAIADDPSVTRNVLLVGMVMAGRYGEYSASRRDYPVWPQRKTLAAQCGLEVSTVSRATRLLVQRGYLTPASKHAYLGVTRGAIGGAPQAVKAYLLTLPREVF